MDQGLIDEGLLPVPDKKSGASHVHKKPMADPEAEENLLYPDDHVPHEMNNEYDAQSEPQVCPHLLLNDDEGFMYSFYAQQL